MFTRKPNGVDDVSPLPASSGFSPGSNFNTGAKPAVQVSSSASSPVSNSSKKSLFEGIKGEGAVLVGAGARIVGDISNSSIVEIQGILEGNVTTNSVIVREGGGFKGQLQTQHAEIHGIVEGTIRIQDLLDIRSTGRVSAEATYGRLAVAAGGSLAGNVQVQPPVIEDLRAETGTDDVGPSNGSAPGWRT